MSVAAWFDVASLFIGIAGLLVLRCAQRRQDRYFERERRRADHLYGQALIALLRDHEQRDRKDRR